jgi:threonine/homoserine/homoserine lactone efflux protein
MMIFRLVFGLLLAASALCFAVYAATREVTWRRRGSRLLGWTLGVALAFFGVLILERVVLLL